jgi:N-acetylmuramoyl-L-alanine amidase
MMKKVLFLTCIFFLWNISTSNPLYYDSTHWAHAGQKTSHIKSRKHAEVTNIRYWSGSTRTRIVVDLDQQVTYNDHFLKKDIALNKPPRLYVDLTGAKLSSHLKQPIPIEAGLLKRIRAGQYAPDTVRVVLDLESVVEYKIFPLTEPSRIVIDVLGTSTTTQKKEAVKPPVSQHKKEAVKPPLSRHSESFKVVIDPGHGGEDPGAIGPTGLKEKDVVLKIAKKVKDKIKKTLRWEVVMTRDDDRFIPLDERTGIANSENAALFLSIHANACTNKKVCGIETFVLGTTTDKDALRLAAKENNISPKQVSDLQVILADLKLNDPQKVIPSNNLADRVQEALVERIHKKYGQVRDLGVKQAPFVVLVGADMPSILIEVSFISNPSEEKRLRNPRYLDALADAIVDGLKKYAQAAKVVKGQSSLSISTALSSN